MGWFEGFGIDYETMVSKFIEKHRESIEKYAKDKAIKFARAYMTVDNLPSLKRVLMLAADQELAEASWKRFDAVVRKYSDLNFTLIGKANIAPLLLEEKIRSAVFIMSGYDYVDHSLRVEYGLPQEEITFTVPRSIWESVRVTGCLQKFIDDPVLFAKLFESLIPSDIKREDPLFYLANLTPILVLYLMLALLGHKQSIERINPLLDLLLVGVIPCHLRAVSGEQDQVFVIVDR